MSQTTCDKVTQLADYVQKILKHNFGKKGRYTDKSQITPGSFTTTLKGSKCKLYRRKNSSAAQ